jgi:hypothetical protein
VGAALIIAGEFRGRPRLGIGRILSIRPFQYIGDRSYALYLWHWPVLVLAMLYERRQLEVKVNLLLLLVALLLSIVSYRLFENPIRRAHWSPRLSAALAPVAVLAAVSVALLSVSSLDSRIDRVDQANAAVARSTSTNVQLATIVPKAMTLPAVVNAVKTALTGAPVPTNLTPPVDQLHVYGFPSLDCSPSAGDPTTQTICHMGNTKSTNKIVVFGDSHALMWMPTILAMAQVDAWNVIPLIRKGCEVPTWTGNGYSWDPASSIGPCHAWYSWARQQAQLLRPEVELISGCCSGSATGSTATTMRQTYAATAAALRPFARNVIVVEDEEGIKAQPVDCLLAAGATLRSCMTTQTGADIAFNNGLPQLAKAKHFGFLKTRGWFCYQNQCPMVVGTTVVYADTGHLTVEYAQRLTGPFRAAFRQCIFATCPR